MFRPFMILAFSLLMSTAYSQQKCPCCTDSYGQFDFWIGEWVVVDTLGSQVGENLITKIEDGCILSERWKGASGSNGRSYSYFNRQDSTWNQVWIDNSGGVLNLKGGFVNENIIMKSALQKGQFISEYYNQITWIPNMDGTVTQRWEILDVEEKVVNVAICFVLRPFDIFFVQCS